MGGQQRAGGKLPSHIHRNMLQGTQGRQQGDKRHAHTRRPRWGARKESHSARPRKHTANDATREAQKPNAENVTKGKKRREESTHTQTAAAAARREPKHGDLEKGRAGHETQQLASMTVERTGNNRASALLPQNVRLELVLLLEPRVAQRFLRGRTAGW